MNKEPHWNFVSTNGSQDEGINNPMIEHFMGNYNYHLAREIIQNSLDAKIDGSKEPVKVNFKLMSLPASRFPGHSELTTILESCLRCSTEAEDIVAQEFFKNALDCIKSSEIPLLKISDYNTKGLSGGDTDRKGGWYNLVRSRGSSPKHKGEGGSFGIGKGASFAASNLRTVYYSTKTEKGWARFQGVAELVSHTNDQETDVKRGVGSYGFGQASVVDMKDIPEEFRRKETGTDIFIAGYKNEKAWTDDLIKSILRNFWYAISEKDLIIEVEKTKIDSENIEHLLSEYFLGEQFKDDVEPIGNPLQYYLAVKMDKAPFLKNLPMLGQSHFYFHETTDHLNYVAMLRRSHMVIYSRRFHFLGNYAGVFICDDEKGNKELSKMEPPAHDKWIPERNKEKGSKIMEELSEYIKYCLNARKNIKTSGSLDIPELYKYLPYDDDSEMGEGGAQYTGKESKVESSRKLQKEEGFTSIATISPYRVSILNEPDSGAGADGGGIGKGRGRGTGGGSGGSGRKSLRKDNLQSRAFITKRNGNKIEYLIILKSKINGKYNIRISAVGEEGSEKLGIVSATNRNGTKYHYKGSYIHDVSLVSGAENGIIVEINSPIKYSLKIDAYAPV